jgi:hypothetical protein
MNNIVAIPYKPSVLLPVVDTVCPAHCNVNPAPCVIVCAVAELLYIVIILPADITEVLTVTPPVVIEIVLPASAAATIYAEL